MYKKIDRIYPELFANRWYIFLAYCLLSVLLLFLIYDVIVTDPKYYTGGNDNSVKLFRNVWSGIYLLYPFYSLAKFFFIGIFMSYGAKMIYKIEVNWKHFFLIITLVSFINLIPYIAEVIWFLVLNTDYHISEVRQFEFLSVYNLIPHDIDIKQSMLIFIDFLDIPEVLYWVTLFYGVAFVLKRDFKHGFTFVLKTYGILVLIMVSIEFCFYYFLLND